MAKTAWHVDERKRTLKAAKIADCLRLLGVTATQAIELEPKDRRMAERAAGVSNRGSEETWRRVIGMLAGSAQVLCPYCGHGDPQGGLGPPLPYGHEEPCNQ